MHMLHLSSLGELLETAHKNEPARWPIHLFKVTENNVVFSTRTPTFLLVEISMNFT